MSATLRIHRGSTSPERVLMLANQPLGPLVDEVTEFSVPPGNHVLSLGLGRYRSVATVFRLWEGEALDLEVVVNPDAVAPALQGGFVKLVPLKSEAAAPR